jgi:hypothetical protein
MLTSTTIRSWPAIGFGVFFALVTGYVLFNDVLHGAPITIAHAMSFGALVAAFGAHHYAAPALKSGAYLAGIILSVVFVAATFFIVVSNGSKNAETAVNKASAIEAANAVRAREEAQLARAAGMLAAAQNTLDEKCVRGKANKGTCDGIRTTISVYTAAIKGHTATLANLPAPKLVNRFDRAARIFQSWGLPITAEWLELNMDFITVLISEFATIAFLKLGLGHKAKPKPIEPTFKDEDLAPLPVETDNVLSFCRAFKAANGRAPSIREVQSKFPDTPKTTAWRKAQAA